MEKQREEFEIVLEECMVKTSPDFDELPGEPPTKKTHQKVATKRQREKKSVPIHCLR